MIQNFWNRRFVNGAVAGSAVSAVPVSHSVMQLKVPTTLLGALVLHAGGMASEQVAWRIRTATLAGLSVVTPGAIFGPDGAVLCTVSDGHVLQVTLDFADNAGGYATVPTTFEPMFVPGGKFFVVGHRTVNTALNPVIHWIEVPKGAAL